MTEEAASAGAGDDGCARRSSEGSRECAPAHSCHADLGEVKDADL